jgi:hypothetical protein
MGAISHAVHREAWASQAPEYTIVMRSIVRVVELEGGAEPGEEVRRWARAEGENEGMTRKWRSARCVIVYARDAYDCEVVVRK